MKTFSSLVRDVDGLQAVAILNSEQEGSLDAAYFRQRAAQARELAQSGEDLRLSRMLLDVATDLDAEAAAIEAEASVGRRRLNRLRYCGSRDALLHVPGTDTKTEAIQIIDLSINGAHCRVASPPQAGTRVTIEMPAHGLHLDGTVRTIRGTRVAVAFELTSRDDLDLSRLLQDQSAA
ncbi:MAG TPA: PilZ domain-containing protein [Rhodopila sp.]